MIVWLKGQPIAVVNGWDIATGRGWIEKAEPPRHDVRNDGGQNEVTYIFRVVMYFVG